MYLKIFIKSILYLSIGVIVGCTHSNMTAKDIPQGFARYTKAKDIKAVSPEGVVYRIRKEENKPFAELSFWREALKKRMLDAGYIFLQENEILAGQKEGHLLELTAPYGQQDYTYLMAIFVNKKQIVIVEATGEVRDLNARRAAILRAIENMQF